MLIYLQMIESEEKRAVFEQIYLEYRQLMFQIAKRILHDDYDAEDAVHQAFLSLIDNLQKISDIKCPETRAFCVVIVENKAIDILRSKKHITQEELSEAMRGIEIPLPGDNGLADALAKIPARYREAILLHFHAGYSTKELAKMFGMTQSSVQKLIWRAKIALREQLEKDGTKYE